MIRFSSAFALLLFVVNTCKAQDLPKISEVTDTAVIRLIKKINAAKHDSTIVRAYMLWDNIIYITDPELDFLLNKKTVELCNRNLSKKTDNKEKTFFMHSAAFALNNMGTTFVYKGFFDSSIVYYSKAIDLCKKFDYKSGVADGYTNIGNVYLSKGSYVSAINYLLDALKIQEEIGDKFKIGQILGNIGIVFHEQEDYGKGLEYFTKSYEINKEIGNKQGMLMTLDNIGLIYFEKKEYTKAKEYHEKSLDVANELKSDLDISRVIYNIGCCLLKKKQIDEAFNFFTKSLQISEENNYAEIIIKSKASIGEIYYEKGDYKKSIEYSSEALARSKEIGIMLITKKVLESLYSSYEKTGEYQKALKTYKEYILLKDSVDNIKNQKEVFKQEFKYQTEKKEQELLLKNKDIELLEKDKKVKNYFLYGLVALVVLFGIIGYLWFRNHKQKQKEVELQNIALEQKLLRLQMNPHFIFNSLSSISGQMLQNLNAAREFLAKFARLMRLILENSREAYVTMKNEVDALNYYLILEQQRFKDKFDFKIEIDSNISVDDVEIPPMLIQPHIENAILHGVTPGDKKGMIHIRFIKESESKIRCEIEDDGIGRKKSSENKEGRTIVAHKSLALEITQERLKTLGEETNQSLVFKIDDLEDENHQPLGTKVSLSLPVKTI